MYGRFPDAKNRVPADPLARPPSPALYYFIPAPSRENTFPIITLFPGKCAQVPRYLPISTERAEAAAAAAALFHSRG